MTTRWQDVLDGRGANYLLPFLWLRGEEEGRLREEIRRIYDAGIGALCIEARPHPDFLGPGWWHDLDIILDEARQRGLKVWILDDDHFPTGHAAGAVVHAPAHLKRQFLHERHVDVIGPQAGGSVLLDSRGKFGPWAEQDSGQLLGVVAWPRDPESNILYGQPVNLTAGAEDNRLYWDIPSGNWRVFILSVVANGGSRQHQDYLNPLVAESTQILLDTVHQVIYERYAPEFGRTIAGFFSDEPGFYNDPTTFDFTSSTGKPGVVLPWSEGVWTAFQQEFGVEALLKLPLLWYAAQGAEHAARYAYMDSVSRLYSENFSQRVGGWCNAHGVEYIGHVLEDNGVHARLGAGAGHYFRAMQGQDMAGIDAIGGQLIPGFDQGPFANLAGDGDGEFFHYGLAKLASSAAHADPRKQGRALCELIGAYGWYAGLKLMKWLTDHLLVRGINHFTPHAFSMADFPDMDCPPHFYARGFNPQYRFYRLLNDYTNRLSHLLSGGQHVAPVAVLYHAEAEWAGPAMPFQKPVRVLAQAQLDCDVISAATLLESQAKAGQLDCQFEQFQALVIPACECLPAAVVGKLTELAGQGVKVVFVDSLPTRVLPTQLLGEGQDLLQRLQAAPVQTVSLEQLAQHLRAQGVDGLRAEPPTPDLRVYRVNHADYSVYFLTNEHPYRSVNTVLTLPETRSLVVYDAFANTLSQLQTGRVEGGQTITLQLTPYQSLTLLAGDDFSAVNGLPSVSTLTAGTELTGEWQVERATSQEYPTFTPHGSLDRLEDLGRAAHLPDFTGTFRYALRFPWSGETQGLWLDLGQVYETVEVWLNGQPLGVKIAPPYVFDLGHHVQEGENLLVVEVTNTLVKQHPDFLSSYAQQEPSGLLGPVRIGRPG